MSIEIGSTVFANGYEGTVAKVHDGALAGMVDVRLPGGIACVAVSELVRYMVAAPDGYFLRGTVLTCERERASRFVSRENAVAAIAKAAPFYRRRTIKAFRIAPDLEVGAA